MSLGDIQVYDEAQFGYPGDEEFDASAAILAGEPIAKTLGNTGGFEVTACATGTPVITTDHMAGIAATSQATAGEKVRVMKLAKGVSYLIAPETASLWNTQSEYDALVGSRILFVKTGAVYSAGATDDSNSGLVVLPLDVAKYPGKVRFAIRNAINYLA